VTLTFDLLTLKVVSESCVTWAISVHRSIYSRLRPDVCERQTDVRQKHCLLGAGHNKPDDDDDDDDDDDEVTEKSDTCEQAQVYCTTSRAKKVTGAMLLVSLTGSAVVNIVSDAAYGTALHTVVISTYSTLFYVIVPLTVLVINVIVVREVRRASNNAAVNLGLQQHQQSTSSNSAVPTAMLVITSLVYVLLNAGSSVMPVLQWWMPRAAFSETTWVVLDKISMVAFAAHTCIYAYNFYVYLITGKQFRSELRKLICRLSFCCC